MAPTLTAFRSYGFLRVGQHKRLCVFSSCSQFRVASPEHCEPLLGYPELLRDFSAASGLP
jgi:hypothetical protein